MSAVRPSVLRRARDLVSTSWAQGAAVCGDAHCVATAIAAAISGMRRSFDEHSLALRAFADANGLPYLVDCTGCACFADAVIDWNDDPARTLDEVLAGFDKALAAAEGGGS